MAAAGGLDRIVDTILLELCLSFPPALKVRNMPPFFSGLGVLDPFLFWVVVCGPIVDGGGDSIPPNVAVVGCTGELLVLVISRSELTLLVYDGLFGGNLEGSGGGLTRSW